MDVFLPLLLQRIRLDYEQPAPHWAHRTPIPPRQYTWLQRECASPSDFDALRLRQRTLQSPRATTHYATCEYGSVAVISEPPMKPLHDIPWDLWGRILRLFRVKHPFHIYFLASPSLRQFPRTPAEPIQPEHINGGYTYPCRPDTIVLYRAEDATRVLIHELHHASCLDHPERGVDHVEAETEAWAEVIYTALLSRGDPARWATLWARQWAWLTSQNRRVVRHFPTSSSTPYPFPWRYTIGKEETIRRWFVRLPPSSPSSPSSSLRLTVPPTSEQKKQQGIRSSSLLL